MQDLLGSALLDYFTGNYSEDILTETSISEEDALPLPYLFRSYAEMPPLEQKALDVATGTVLDVGCGAGSHSLYLQDKGLKVLAIDVSKGAIEVTKQRGVTHTRHIDLMHLNPSAHSEEKFDTILLLMNGTGIFQKIDQVSKYLQHLKMLLAPNGQILIDSSDLQYMYDATEEGGIIVPANHYYGELEFVIKYKGMESKKFPWLYLDEDRFQSLCKENGLYFKILTRGENFDYLAQLKILKNTPS
ncbi:MAG: class I SAM-dependent methyltransferase [Flavobacteriaceae bacterium]|nr:class I SAM-dependent methyltransferase [Flavobacteriaceae bacterium]